MKRIIGLVAALAAAVALTIGLGATAQAAPDGPASYVQITRTASTTQNLSNNGSYVSVATTAKWSIQNSTSGYTFDDTSGITVPVAGVYQLSWSLLLTSGANGICGFAVNGDVPDGGLLHGIGPVTNLAAASGNGSTVLPLQANDDLKFWCYGSGASMSIQDSVANRLSVTLIDEL
jgi:hypothetical protein